MTIRVRILWTVNRVPVWLLIIPALWSVTGFTAALRLGVHEDIGLLVAGLAGVTIIVYRERRQKQKGILASA